MEIKKGVALAPYTTFKIGGPAAHFVELKILSNITQCLDFAKNANLKILILGGGSNSLISDSGFLGVVALVENTGWDIVTETDSDVTLRIAAGEIWDQLVKEATVNNWWGIENLSHIPGSVGASVVQNIGAYGQEVSQVVESVEAINLDSGKTESLTQEQCHFNYRSSLFNSEQRGKYLIWSITIKLSKLSKPRLDYVDLKKRFENNPSPTIDKIRQAVIEIRNQKYPFPTQAIMGNAGSFFKNSNLNQEEYTFLKEKLLENFGEEAIVKLEQIKNRFPQVQKIKIPTAFLMQLCELKGLIRGNVQINENNPLVLLNRTGQAKAAEVLAVVKEVRQVLKDKTGLWVAIEPELIGFSSSELAKYGLTDEESNRYKVFGV